MIGISPVDTCESAEQIQERYYSESFIARIILSAIKSSVCCVFGCKRIK
jgi:hypothetical protein